MPVIRGQAQVSDITAEQRKQVAEQLAKELSGQQTPNGPVIFEIPFEERDRIDVLVVWDAWRPFSSTDRSTMILDAYKTTGSKSQIAQALGVTHQEAIEQQALPYAVVPMVRRGEINEEEVKKAMLAEGGFALPNGKVDLRFPTMPLAEEAHKRLADVLPRGYWSIVQTVGYLE
jgi:hypothetical protein